MRADGSLLRAVRPEANGPTSATVREFLHDAAEELFSVDGKLWRTLKLLFLRPGTLTVELVNGRRASYVKPLRLYLTCSMLAFGALALTSEGVQIGERDRAEMRDGVPVPRPGEPAIGVGDRKH